MSKLFQSIKIRGIEFPNRVGFSPCCTCSADKEGNCNDFHLQHYGSRAAGGCGLVIIEATGIRPEGRLTSYDLGAWSDSHIPSLTKLADMITFNGSVPAIQLNHAGRRGSRSRISEGFKKTNDYEIVAPTAIKYDGDDSIQILKELTIAQIKEIIKSFISAAVRSVKAGFKVIEIHAAHGMLINQFLCKLTNKRTDEYGGSFSNRIRILCEIVDGIRQSIPSEIPLFCRISATDYSSIQDSWQLTPDSTDLSKELFNRGVDLIDCSSGGNLPPSDRDLAIEHKEGYMLNLAETIKNKVPGIKVSTVGYYKTPEYANDVISNQKADFILLGKELLRNPYWARNSAKILKCPLSTPQAYFL